MRKEFRPPEQPLGEDLSLDDRLIKAIDDAALFDNRELKYMAKTDNPRLKQAARLALRAQRSLIIDNNPATIVKSRN